MVIQIDETTKAKRRRFLLVASTPLTLLVIVTASLSFADETAVSPTIESLRTLDVVPLPATRDWLVEAIDRKAGLYRGTHPAELVLDNGLLRRSFLVAPNVACVDFRQLASDESLLRAIRPECRVTIDGREYEVGGLQGQPIQNFLRHQWYDNLRSSETALQCVGFTSGRIAERFVWKPRTEWMATRPDWPPRGVALVFHYQAPQANDGPRFEVDVHYDLYDNIPLIAKWFTLRNVGREPFKLDTFVSETVAYVEASSQVEDLIGQPLPNVHVETDFTSCAMDGRGSQRDTVHWLPDPQYKTQVNYLLKTPCLLECRPPLGPSLTMKPGDAFASFRTWTLAFDDRDALRTSLALDRMYRTIAPWVAENPTIFHVRQADSNSVRAAIDQAHAVGFDLVLMTFGSGFNIEDESEANIQRIRSLADYAHDNGVALGGYSLLASRSVSPEDDVVNPETGKPGGFARFGNSPCLESAWGQDYFRKLLQFYERTGCDVLEHDGSYPGDACASERHPGHANYDDSRWRQWTRIRDFYRWCRAQGIYLNVPDWYFLNGSNKTGMGYRETNWSLPRDLQEIIERQNIHDGTRFKTPTMGWMFVPLTEYHGGGPAATIEPLDQHRDHYERRLQNLLGAGVQACFRGPRLYDTDETKNVVSKWIRFYKSHKAILDSPLIPLRRADGRDWDGWIHVNPQLDTPALAMVYNPLEQPIERSIAFPLYYAGIRNTSVVVMQDGATRSVHVDDRQHAKLDLTVPGHGAIWLMFKK
ncbi:MAG: hypothetical protein R3E01_31475 [Pirellulaceae bacterium]